MVVDVKVYAYRAREWLFSINKRRLYLIALSMRLFLLGFFGESWDIYVFITTTKQFLFEGVTPYEIALKKPPYIYMPFYPYIENWYAYPPLMLLIFSFFYLLYLAWPVKAPFFERFFIKLPMALGDLLLAYYAGKIVYYFSNDERKTRHAELAILFNPFFILISSVWGMFDALAMAFLLIAVDLSINEEFHKSAVVYAIAVLVKQTTLFASLVLFFYWWRKKGFKKTLIYTSTALLVFFGVSLPFLLSTPWGFLQQILMLHVNRPPWGYNIFTAIYFILIYVASGLIIGNPVFNLAFLAFISALSLSLLATTILFIGVWVFKKSELTKLDLIFSLMLTYFSFIFLSKVTNEPYFIYLMTLIAIYSLIKYDARLFKEFSSLSYYLLLSTLIAAMRFLIFIPSDVLMMFFGKEIAERLWQLTPIYGEANPYVVVTLAIGAILIVPTFLSLFKYYYDNIKEVLNYSITPRFILELFRNKEIKKSLYSLGKYKAVLIIVLILMFSYQSATLSKLIVYGNQSSVITLEGRIVGIHYTWMDNPSHDPTKKVGSWADAYLTPIEGYYESKVPYMARDLTQITSAGINTLVIEVYLGRSPAVSTLAELALDYNLSFIPYIDLGEMVNISYFSYINPDLGNGTKIPGLYELKLATWTTFLNTFLDITDVFNMPNIIKFGNKPVVIVDGVTLVYPGFDSEAISYQITNLFNYFNISNYNTSAILEFFSKRWNVTLNTIDDIFKLYPKNLTALLNTTNPISRDFLSVYAYSFYKFWSDLISAVEQQETGLYIIFGYMPDPLKLFNLENLSRIGSSLIISRYYSYKLLSQLSIEDYINATEMIAAINPSNVSIGVAQFITLNSSLGPIPLYSMYNLTWNLVIEQNANLTIIYSWNDYVRGSVIEPTVELNEKPLQLTKYYIDKLAPIEMQWMFMLSRLKESAFYEREDN